MSKLEDPIWLKQALSYIGTKELKGRRHNPTILRWLKELKYGFTDDETPWCGTFVAAVLNDVEMPFLKNGAWSRAWLKYSSTGGEPVVLDKPAVGAIVVFWRGKRSGWSGHVGFVVGKDRYGNLMVVGGNQGDMVKISPFDTNRVLGYIWPGTKPYASRFDLPIIDSNGKVSTNEA